MTTGTKDVAVRRLQWQAALGTCAVLWLELACVFRAISRSRLQPGATDPGADGGRATAFAAILAIATLLATWDWIILALTSVANACRAWLQGWLSARRARAMAGPG